MDNENKVKNNETSPKKKKHTWLLIVLLLFLPPVGIIYMWVARKDMSKTKRIVLTVIFAIYFMLLMSDGDSNDTSKNAETNNATTVSVETTKAEKSTEKETTKKAKKKESKKAYKKSCKKYKYKNLIRNPEKYEGKRIKVTIKIQQKMDGGFFDDNVYFRGYTNDEHDWWMGDEYLIKDLRENADLKLLDDDIITVYGEYAGVQDVERAITSTDDEIPIIDAKYIKLIGE